MTFWGAICIVLGLAGLVGSFFVWRSKGATRGMRAVAWSLIPLAAYLTGAATLLSRISSAIVRFAGSFVFSPKSWLGVAFLGVAVLLFLTSGGLPLLKWNKRRAAAKNKNVNGTSAAPAAGDGRAAAPAAIAKGRRSAAPADDDLSEIQEILNRRGIK
jgi:hypothetical protein